MSDTPETDAQLTTYTSISKLRKHFTNKKGTVSAGFARKLERERNQWMECAKAFATTVIAAPDMQFVPAMRRYEKLKEVTQ